MRSLRFNAGDWICLLAYVLLVVFVALNHELSHDEAQAWNIARSAQWPWDVIWHGRYDGHTPLWHLILWPLTLTKNPYLMQLLGVLIGVCAAALLLRDKPFPRIVCLLIIFGYFFFYEYTIIARPYILTVLLCALIASSLHRRTGNFAYLTALCCVMAFTSPYSLVLSGTVYFLVLSEYSAKGSNQQLSHRQLLIGMACYALVAALSIWFIVFPIEHRTMEVEILTGQLVEVTNVPAALSAATFPHFNRLPLNLGSWLSTSASGNITIIAASLLVALCLAIWLSGRRNTVNCLLMAIGSITVAMLFTGLMSERHMGHLFLAAITLAWARDGLTKLPASEQQHGFTKFAYLPEASKGLRNVAAACLVLVLLYQLCISAGVSSFDVAKKISPWKEVAQFLHETEQQPYTLLTDHVYNAAALVAYADAGMAAEPYNLRCRCSSRYGRWQSQGRKPVTPEDFKRQWCEFLEQKQPVVALITKRGWWEEDNRFELIKQFEAGYRDPRIVPRLYRFKDNPEPVCETLLSQ